MVKHSNYITINAELNILLYLMSYLVGVPDMGVIPVIGVVVSDSFLESFFIWA